MRGEAWEGLEWNNRPRLALPGTRVSTKPPVTRTQSWFNRATMLWRAILGWGERLLTCALTNTSPLRAVHKNMLPKIRDLKFSGEARDYHAVPCRLLSSDLH